MTENTNAHDVPLLRETQKLLSGLQVGPGRSALVEGTLVTVLVATTWEEDQSFSLGFTCRARGRTRPRWSRLGLWARQLPLGQESRTYRVELSGVGQGWISCCPGSYVTRAVYLDEVAGFRAPASRTVKMAASPVRPAGTGSSLPEVRLARSEDGRVTATILSHRARLEIIFETTEADLADATVQLFTQDAISGALEPVAEIPLREAGSGMWRGSWSGPPSSVDQEFRFTVTPCDPPEGDS